MDNFQHAEVKRYIIPGIRVLTVNAKADFEKYA